MTDSPAQTQWRITKASTLPDGTMTWKATTTKFSRDVQKDLVTRSFYEEAIRRFKSGTTPPPFFSAAHYPAEKVCNCGFEFKSLKEYNCPQCGGERLLAGITTDIYIDGDQPKARGVFYPTALGKSIFESVKNDIANSTPEDERVRISMGFYPDPDGYVIKSGGRDFLKGWIEHFAATRVPVVSETDLEVKSLNIKTKYDDAVAIVPKALADKLVSLEQRRRIGKSDADDELVIKSDKSADDKKESAGTLTIETTPEQLNVQAQNLTSSLRRMDKIQKDKEKGEPVAYEVKSETEADPDILRDAATTLDLVSKAILAPGGDKKEILARAANLVQAVNDYAQAVQKMPDISQQQNQLIPLQQTSADSTINTGSAVQQPLPPQAQGTNGALPMVANEQQPADTNNVGALQGLQEQEPGNADTEQYIPEGGTGGSSQQEGTEQLSPEQQQQLDQETNQNEAAGEEQTGEVSDQGEPQEVEGEPAGTDQQQDETEEVIPDDQMPGTTGAAEAATPNEADQQAQPEDQQASTGMTPAEGTQGEEGPASDEDVQNQLGQQTGEAPAEGEAAPEQDQTDQGQDQTDQGQEQDQTGQDQGQEDQTDQTDQTQQAPPEEQAQAEANNNDKNANNAKNAKDAKGNRIRFLPQRKSRVSKSLEILKSITADYLPKAGPNEHGTAEDHPFAPAQSHNDYQEATLPKGWTSIGSRFMSAPGTYGRLVEILYQGRGTFDVVRYKGETERDDAPPVKHSSTIDFDQALIWAANWLSGGSLEEAERPVSAVPVAHTQINQPIPPRGGELVPIDQRAKPEVAVKSAAIHPAKAFMERWGDDVTGVVKDQSLSRLEKREMIQKSLEKFGSEIVSLIDASTPISHDDIQTIVEKSIQDAVAKVRAEDQQRLIQLEAKNMALEEKVREVIADRLDKSAIASNSLLSRSFAARRRSLDSVRPDTGSQVVKSETTVPTLSGDQTVYPRFSAAEIAKSTVMAGVRY